ncbi:Thiol:disulfide interchange protein DsbD precursor [Planctomycetes bacterium Pla163]|uniref:Thiol:disulfide interchange protein DsbD n=1 Tax=Rohdeia mirabilis TaxID=2528008 RepID=A0A518D518_9BACT|nr:Thiol:disulfide interchange protein DsbD precursor [Planctomycetes bacterium Pla163]
MSPSTTWARPALAATAFATFVASALALGSEPSAVIEPTHWTASVQVPVGTELFHRVVDGEVRVILEVDVDDGFHVYHPVAGPGFALPTQVTFTAPGVTFGDAVFPVPDVEVQKGLGSKAMPDTFVWGHHGTFHVLATGTFDDAAGAEALDASDVTYELEGQVCDVNGCVTWEDGYESEGDGAGDEVVDALFADTDWEGLYTGWPYPLAALESEVMRAVNTAGADPDEVLAAGIAAARGDGAPTPAAVQEAPAAKAPKPFTPGGSNFGGLGGSSNNAHAEFYHRVVGDQIHGVFVFEVDEGSHLYHPFVGPGIAQPTVVTLEAAAVRWNDVVFPEPEAEPQKGLGADGADAFVWAHHGTFAAYVTGTVAQDARAPGPDDIAITIEGQTCDEKGCVTYHEDLSSEGDGAGDAEIDALFAGADWDALYANWPLDLATREAATYVELGLTAPAIEKGVVEPAEPAEGGDGTGDEEGDGLLQLLLLAIGGGLFALVMPCTYPMIPITISYFTKQAEARNGHVWPLALVYGGGIVGMFTSIGLIVLLFDVFADALGLAKGDAGSAIIRFAVSGGFNLAIGVMFLYFALVLFGAINLNPPQWAMGLVGKAQGKGGIGGLFMMGALLVVTSFTCTGPFVGSILGTAAQQGGTRVLLGMFVFGLTLATPFVLLSLVPGRVSTMPKAGAWMNTVKIALGFVEIAAALKFFSNVDLAWNWGILPRELFLWMWAMLALITAAFLFGFIKVKGESGEIGPGRMAVASAFAVLAAYFGYGAMGNQLGGAMTALAPPYSNRVVNNPKIDEIERTLESIKRALSQGGDGATSFGDLKESGPVVIVDDLEAAAQKAQELGRGLLINFTGHI